MFTVDIEDNFAEFLEDLVNQDTLSKPSLEKFIDHICEVDNAMEQDQEVNWKAINIYVICLCHVSVCLYTLSRCMVIQFKDETGTFVSHSGVPNIYNNIATVKLCSLELEGSVPIISRDR